MKEVILSTCVGFFLIGCSATLEHINFDSPETKEAHAALQSDFADTNSSEAVVAVEDTSVEVINKDNKFISASSVDASRVPRSYLPIRFEFNSATIPDSQKAKMFYNYDLAKCDMAKAITVIGYADKTGNSRYNFDLGLARASAVSEALISHGVDPSKIRIKSGGEQFLNCFDDTPSCHAKNRIVIITESVN